MYERFSDPARKVMALAQEEAHHLNHEYIGTEHILLGLIRLGSGTGITVLNRLSITPEAVQRELKWNLLSGPEGAAGVGKLPQAPRAKKVMEYAIEEARNLHHDYVGTEHLLLGLLREREGLAAQALTKLGLKVEAVREAVALVLGSSNLTPESGPAIPPIHPTVQRGEQTISYKVKPDTLSRVMADLILWQEKNGV